MYQELSSSSSSNKNNNKKHEILKPTLEYSVGYEGRCPSPRYGIERIQVLSNGGQRHTNSILVHETDKQRTGQCTENDNQLFSR